MVEQIENEIKIMYGLNHKNIIQLHNHFEEDKSIYLVIEYAPGVFLLIYLKFINNF